MIQTRISSTSIPNQGNLILVSKENRSVSTFPIIFSQGCFSIPYMVISSQLKQMDQEILVQGIWGMKNGFSNYTRISKMPFCGGVSWVPSQLNVKQSKSSLPLGRNIKD
jgi:hypothetical protein